MSRSYGLNTAVGQGRKEAAVSYYLHVFLLWVKTWAECHGALLRRPPKMARAEHRLPLLPRPTRDLAKEAPVENRPVARPVVCSSIKEEMNRGTAFKKYT